MSNTPENTSVTIMNEKDYISNAQDIMNDTMEILNSDGWKLEKEGKNGNRLYSKVMPDIGTVWKVMATIHGTPQLMKKELFTNVVNSSKWQTNVFSTKRLKVFNEETDIVYTVNKAGPFTSDILELRKCHITKNTCVIASRSIDYSDESISRTYYRIHNYLNCWALEEVNSDTKESILQGMAAFKCNIWFPYAIRKFMLCDSLMNFADNIRNHFEKLQDLDQQQKDKK